jgi:threonine dehydrogenase-like Zn-dependent dehydrogenase
MQDAISAGSMKPHDMITKMIKLNEVEEEGFKALINDKDNNVKILVEVHGGE